MRTFGKFVQKKNPAGSEQAGSSVGKQVGIKVTVSLIAEAVKRVLIDIGYPWF